MNAGSDPTASGKFGETPLRDAARYNGDDVIAGLINAGADLEAKDGRDRAPLHHPGISKHGHDIIVALLEAGADSMASDDGGKIPGDYATNNEEPEDTDADRQLLDRTGSRPEGRTDA